MSDHSRLNRLRKLHSLVMSIGIAANSIVIYGLFFVPDRFMALLHVPPDHSIWVRFAANLLLLLSIFYLPAIWDLQRYRIIAWLAVFPSRAFGTIFFTAAVFIYNFPIQYLLFAGDIFFFLAQGYLLLKITFEEKKQGVDINIR